MINKTSRNSLRRSRQSRVRKNVNGTTERPRLVVFRSLSHIYAQIVNDIDGRTLASASSLDKGIKEAGGTFKERAEKVGALIGGKAQEAGITQVVFDRAGYKYHGRVKALADAARTAGLQF